MDFDYTQVYTAFNAEGVKVGDIVFIGYKAEGIYEKVEQAEYAARLVCMITGILPRNQKDRFVVTTGTGFKVHVPYVYMLHNKGSEFYDFAKAIYEGKPVWCHVDGKVTEQKSIVFNHPASCYTLGISIPRMQKKWNGLYTFNYKGFDCEIAECSGTDRYVCFVDYWDSDEQDCLTDLVYWCLGSNCDLGNNYIVPKFIMDRLDDWIKENSSRRATKEVL